MEKLLIVRHGQTEGDGSFKGNSQVQLSEEGVHTLFLVGKILEAMRYEPDVILSSTYPRAIQSALLLNNQEGPQYKMTEFDEVNVGNLVGKKAAIQLDEYDRNAAKNGAETSQEALARVKSGLDYLADLPFEKGIAVSHSMLMTLLYAFTEKAEGLPETQTMYNGCGFWLEFHPKLRITELFPDTID